MIFRLGKRCMATIHALVASGVWEHMNQALSRQVRLQAGRNEQPSLVMVDSQSVKMAQKGG